MAEISVANDELRTTREAMRELNALLDQLDKGDIEKIVLTARGQFRGVLLSVSEYAQLTQREGPPSPKS
jgi:hypothetical protein